MACWLLGVGILVETKSFYEMINLMTVITGNVQLTSSENRFFSKINPRNRLNIKFSSSDGHVHSPPHLAMNAS